jgi:uncharacterized protein (DUF2344 family)
MKFTTGVFLLSFLLLLAACQNKPVSQKESVFAIDSILKAQNKTLLHFKASVTKEVLMDGKTEKTNMIPGDSLAWANELLIFQQLSSINKTVNRGVYQESIYSDSTSNLTIRQLKTDKKLPLKELKIYYLNSPEKIRKVEGYVREENALYSSARLLSLHFSEVCNKTLLTSYNVIGGQHMILGDTVQFNIQSTIQVN